MPQGLSPGGVGLLAQEPIIFALRDDAALEQFHQIGISLNLTLHGRRHMTEGTAELLNLQIERRNIQRGQQLARLRMEDVVTARRDGQTIFYSIKDRRIVELLDAYARIFGAAVSDR